MKLHLAALAIGIVAANSAMAEHVDGHAAGSAPAVQSSEPSAMVQEPVVAEAMAPEAPVMASVDAPVELRVAKPAPNTRENWLGAYIVGQFGQAKAELDAPGVKADDTAIAARLGAGYRFNQFVSVEASGGTFGRFDVDGVKISSRGVQAGAQFRLPLGYVYGTASELAVKDSLLDRTALYVRTDVLAIQFGGDIDKESDVAPSFAVGVETNLGKGYSVRGEYQHSSLKIQDADIDLNVVSVGVSKTM